MNNLKVTKKIINLNKRIQTGYNSTSWILNILIGSSIISYIFSELGIITLLPAACIPIVVTGIYYYIGSIHQEQEEHDIKEVR